MPKALSLIHKQTAIRQESRSELFANALIYFPSIVTPLHRYKELDLDALSFKSSLIALSQWIAV